MTVVVQDGSPTAILHAMQAVLANPNAFSSEFDNIEFGKWAAIKVHLPQEDLVSSIRPSYMEAFLELQKQIYQLAALAKSGTPDARALSDAEREDLQISVLVTEGSSDYRTDLIEPLRKLLGRMVGKMTGRQTMVVILGIAALAAGTYSFTTYLQNTKEIKIEELKSKDHLEALQAIEFVAGADRKTIEEITEILKTQGDIGRQAIEAVKATNDALLKAAAQTPKSVINGVEITKREAEILRTNPRRKVEPSAVLKLVKVVDINTSDPVDLKIVLVDAETQALYRINFKDNLFAGPERHKLFQALEDRQPIWAELSIKEANGVIRSVELLRTTDSPDE